MARIKLQTSKPLLWRYPQRVENQYNNLLSDMVDNWKKGISIALERYLHTIIFQFNEATRADTYEDSFNAMMENVDTTLVLGMQEVLPKIRPILVAASVFNKNEWERIMVRAITVSLWKPESWHHAFLEERLKINTALIRKLSTDVRDQIEDTVSRGIKAGLSTRSLTQQILQETELQPLNTEGFTNTASVIRKARHRAETIAVDQIGKWNGDLTRQRQKDIGLSRYRWKHLRDRRVRGKPGGKWATAKPSHWHREDQLYVWEYTDKLPSNTLNPPSDGHPGFPVRCRCYASPYFNDLFLEGVNNG